ncbi:MAG: YCF48-related protein, partial [Crocinitomicaceae bacterium]
MVSTKIVSRLLIVLSLFLCQSIYAAVYYVDDNSNLGDIYTPNVTGVNSSSVSGSATAPFRTLKYALSKATTNDIIYVDAGTYTDHFIYLTLSGIKIIGAGKDKTIFNHQGITAENPLWFLTVSGTSFSMQDLTVKNYKTYGTLYINCSSYSDSTRVNIANCNFENNENSGLGNSEGGAISIDMANDFTGKPAVATINNCSFKNNLASNNGGAIYVEGKSRLIITGSSFCNNQTQGSGSSTGSNGGGAIFSDNSYTKIIGSTFYGNNADYFSGGYGGAVMSLSNTIAPNKTLYISGCSFGANNAKRGGGVFVGNRINAVIENSLFYTNNATETGGAIYMRDANTSTDASNAASSSIKLVNSTLVGNSTSSNDPTMVGGLHVQMALAGISVDVNNSILWNNEHKNIYNSNLDGNSTSNSEQYVRLSNSIINGGETAFINGGNVITSDPLFKNVSLYDYRLLSGSPALGAGSTSNLLAIDMVGTPRTQSDIGAYANGATTMLNSYECTADPNAGVMIDATTSTLCKGSSSTLTATGAVSYTWSPSTGLSVTTGSSVIATPQTTTTYTVSGIMADGSTKTNTVTLTVNTPQTVIATTSTPTITKGGTATLTSSGSQTYTWSPSTGLSSVTGNNIVASPLQTTIYTVTGIDASGCNSTDTVKVTVICNLTVSSTKTNNALSITPSNGVAPYSYLWSDGSTSQNRTNLVVGNYQLIVTDNAGCKDTSTFVISNEDLCSTFSLTLTSSIRGQVTASVSNAPSSVQYSFQGGNYSTTNNWKGLVSGQYIVGAKSLSCIAYDTLTLVEPIDSTKTGGFGCKMTADLTQRHDTLFVSIADGKSPFTVTWQDGSHLSPRKITQTGNYVAYITDANLCTSKDSILVTQVNVDPVDSICSRFKLSLTSTQRGQVTASVSNAPSSVQYSFQGGNYNTTNTWKGLFSGQYIVGAKSLSCIAKDTITMYPGTTTLPSGCSMSVVSNKSAGSVTLTVYNGNSPISYLWNDGITTKDRIGLTAGNYSVIIKDKDSCIVQDSIHIDYSCDLSLKLTSKDITCFGYANGVADVEVFNGIKPYVVKWNGIQGGLNRINLTLGQYIIKVKDARGCEATDSIYVNQPNQLQAQAIKQSNSISITTQGGTSPYSYLWNNKSKESFQNNLKSGIYSVVVTDSHYCKDTITGILIDTNGTHCSLQLTEVVNNVPCKSKDGGYIELNLTGTHGAVSYTWTKNGLKYGFTKDIYNLSSGTYTFIAVDETECSFTKTYTITEPVSVLNSTINLINGTATVVPTGGTPNYSYLWSTGATTSSIKGITKGTYSVLTTDSKGCQYKSLFLVDSTGVIPPCSLIVNSTITNEKCNGDATGYISLDVTGGIAPYTYRWDNNSNLNVITGLTGGSYGVTIIDSKGCSVYRNYTLLSPKIINTKVDVEDCEARVEVVGGIPSYSYLWSNGSTVANERLSIGQHTLKVTDANLCTSVVGIEIDTTCKLKTSSPDCNLLLSLKQQSVSCHGGNDGKISVQVSRGIGPFTYEWNTGATQSEISNLSAGTYTVLVGSLSDPTCARVTASTTITAPENPLSVSIQVSNFLATANVTGGNVEKYTYAWSTGASTKQATLPVGNSYLTVTDSKGCTGKALVNVGTSGTPTNCNLVVTPTIIDNQCEEGHQGSISLQINNSSNYAFQWNNGSTTSFISSLKSGVYTVFITDQGASKCKYERTYTVKNQYTKPVLTLQVVNGVAQLEVDGIAPFNYKWSTGATTNSITGLTFDQEYSVTVQDSSGCESTSSFVYKENGTPTICNLKANIKSIDADGCKGVETGTAEVEVTGGVAPYRYDWSNGAITQKNSNLGVGTYYVTVTDVNECKIFKNIEIGLQSSNFALSIEVDKTLPSANLKVSGAVEPISILWSNGMKSPSIQGFPIGVYSVDVVDAQGCKAKSGFTYTGTQITCEAIVKAIPVSPKCYGGNDGSITLDIKNASSPISYTWSTGVTTKDISGLSAGSYSVIVKYGNGCVLSSSTNITNVGSELTLLLNRNTETQVEAIVNGGLKPYQYHWTNATNSKVVTVHKGEKYTCTVTDSRGCVVSKTLNLEENPTNSDDFLLTVDHTDELCAGASNGEASVSITGNTGPYQILWSNGQTSSSISGLEPGTYTVEVTDIERVTRSASVTIQQAARLLNSKINLKDSYICNNSTVEATISTSASQVIWSNGATAKTIQITKPGVYNVTVFGQNGCKEQSDEVVVIDKTPNTTILNGTTGSICFGNTMTLTAASNKGPYEWKKNGILLGSSRNIELKDEGIYTLSITKNGCTSSTNFQLLYKPSNECTDTTSKKPSGLCSVLPSKEISVDFDELCRQNLRNIAKFNAEVRFKYIQDSLRNDFEQRYISKCMNVYENFTMSYVDREHHYTLYYYDNAGNLVRTVPPQGVSLIKDPVTLAKIKDDRFKNQRNIFTNHSYATTYKYNSLNQLVSQDVPDNERMDIVTISAANNGIPTTDKTIQAQMTASSNGYMLTNDANNQSHLYTTQNGGTNWDEASLVGKSNLNATQILDDGTIYSVGSNGVFVSMSPTLGQEEVFLPNQVAENVNLKALYFENKDKGFVFAEDGTIWKVDNFTSTLTTDKWNKISSLQTLLKGQLQTIHFNSQNEFGYVISNHLGKGYVYRTSDGGLTWVQLTNFRTNQKLNQVQMISDFRGFAVGEDGTLLATEDKGQNWHYIPTGISGSIKQINFVSNTEGYMVEASGLMYKTIDAGNVWKLQTLSFPVSKIANDYKLGLIVLSGDGKIYKSKDNGISWNAMSRELSSDAYVHVSNGDKVALSASGKLYTYDNPILMTPKWVNYGTISLPTEAIQTIVLSSSYKINQLAGVTKSVKGVQLRSNNKIYYTLNGKDYLGAQVPLSTEVYTALMVNKDGSGYAISKTGQLIQTSDFGKTWTNSTSSLTLEAGEYVTDLTVNTTLVAVGSKGTIWQQTAGENSWNNVAYELAPASLNSVGYVNVSNVNGAIDKVVLAGVDGRIFTSEDGGASFAVAKTNKRDDFTSMYFDGTKVIFGTSTGSIYKTTFDVSSLTKEYTATSQAEITSISQQGTLSMAVDNIGNIYTSTATGVWNKESFSSTNGLNAIALSATKGIVCVGDKGSIYRKLAGATTWNNVSATFPKDIVAYSVTDDGIGYFASATKQLYVSRDGGATVSKVVNFTFPADVVKIVMQNATTGNFVSTSGIYGIKINQGQPTVTLQESGLSSIKDIFVGYGITGVVVSGSGTIKYSTDGGVTWNNSLTDVYTQLNAVSMVNNKVGYAVGNTGTILKTSNGGASWVQLTNNGKSWMNTSLTSVYFMDENNGYVAGASNLLYKTDDAGATFTLVQKIGLGTQGNIASLVKNGENGMMILGDGSQSATN